MKKQISWFFSTLIAGLIAAIATVIIDWVMKKPILTTIDYVFKAIVNAFSFVLNFNFKTWWLIIIVLVIFILRFLGTLFRSKKGNEQPRFLHYTGDRFNYFIWKWDWTYNDIIHKWEISSLRPLCLDDNCRSDLVYQQSSFRAIEPAYVCTKCATSYKAKENIDTVSSKIVNKANRGDFPYPH